MGVSWADVDQRQRQKTAKKTKYNDNANRRGAYIKPSQDILAGGRDTTSGQETNHILGHEHVVVKARSSQGAANLLSAAIKILFLAGEKQQI